MAAAVSELGAALENISVFAKALTPADPHGGERALPAGLRGPQAHSPHSSSHPQDLRASRRVFPIGKSTVRRAKAPLKPSRVLCSRAIPPRGEEQALRSFQGGKYESKISIPHPAIFRALSVSVGNSVYSVLQ